METADEASKRALLKKLRKSIDSNDRESMATGLLTNFEENEST